MFNLFIICFFISIPSFAKTIRIAILDTGYFTHDSKSFKSCDNGKYDYNATTDSTIDDIFPHGQNILHIVTRGLKRVDYCVINIKIMTRDKPFHAESYVEALKYVLSLNVDIVNLSYFGTISNKDETFYIKQIIDNGAKVVASAGNDHYNLNKECVYYPACVDNRIYVVGSIDSNKKISSFSNYGKNVVKYWEMGRNVKAGGITISGTSQAAAIKTNKLVKEMAKCK